MSRLAALTADLLSREADAVAARWSAQLRPAAPLAADCSTETERADDVDAAGGETTSLASTASGVEPEDAERLVHAVADALRGSPLAHEALTSAGWDAGVGAHAARLSLHDLLKALDVLGAVVLHAAKRAAVREAVGDAADAADARDAAADGVEVARRVQRALSALTLAASKGFTHGYTSRLQETFRVLRHELRNPLGTIESAVALMEDERIAPELRDSPRFRAMVVRNAKAIEALIAERLSDVAALASEFGPREVSLRDVALSVRRDLREEAQAKACDVLVADELPTALVDPAEFELALKSAMTAALHAAPRRSAIVVGLRERRERSAVVAVACEPQAGEQRPAAQPPSALARTFLEHSGGHLWVEDGDVCLEVPTSVAPARPARTSAAHAAHDVAGAS